MNKYLSAIPFSHIYVTGGRPGRPEKAPFAKGCQAAVGFTGQSVVYMEKPVIKQDCTILVCHDSCQIASAAFLKGKAHEKFSRRYNASPIPYTNEARPVNWQKDSLEHS